jgi:hypothetical protein
MNELERSEFSRVFKSCSNRIRALGTHKVLFGHSAIALIALSLSIRLVDTIENIIFDDDDDQPFGRDF